LLKIKLPQKSGKHWIAEDKCGFWMKSFYDAIEMGVRVTVGSPLKPSTCPHHILSHTAVLKISDMIQ
jgi:hypothetical protein